MGSGFSSIAVIGAGTMGSAIAQHFLLKGHGVQLLERDARALQRGLAAIADSMDQAEARHIIDAEQKHAMRQRLHSATELTAAADADYLVEAIFEDLDAKRALLAALEDIVDADCILASNTSSFQIRDLQTGLRHPERVLGVHYFYHAAKNKLVEIIAGEDSDRDIAQRLMDFYAALDKIPIAVRDCPGFAVNRFFVPWLNEAVRLQQEGIGSMVAIDRIACRVFGIGMGPFALMNATGVPIALHAARGLAKCLGALYAPAERLVQQVESGQPWDLQAAQDGQAVDEETISRRLLGAAMGCAAAVVSEGNADATSIDLGARVGLRWRHGPFELINRYGLAQAREMVTSVFQPFALALPTFPFQGPDHSVIQLQWVAAVRHLETGFVVFKTPDRMNALGEVVMRQLDASFRVLDADARVKRIIFVGQGKAFVAGADIRFFLDAMDAGEIQRIVDFTRSGQALFTRIAASAKPTIAYIDGLALGGGLELALACQHRWGSVRARLGLPETGIGLYPGLGGTQRLPRLIGRGPAKRLIATGEILDAQQAWSYGLLDRLVERVVHWRELAKLEIDPPGRRPERAGEDAVFADFDGLLDGDWLDQDACKPFAKALRRKAPQALRRAMALVDDGADLPLQQALELELQGLAEIFAGAEARVGLHSVVSRSRPHFGQADAG